MKEEDESDDCSRLIMPFMELREKKRRSPLFDIA